MSIRKLGLACCVAAAVPALMTAQDPSPAVNRLALADSLDYETVQDPKLSPDGSQIVCARQWIDKVNDRRESSIWIMGAGGSRNRVLVEGSDAAWSPSGDRIAYVAQGKPKGSQIVVRWMDAEGAVTQVTRVDDTPRNLRWSPDGSQIAFLMNVDQKETWPIKLPKAPEGATWTEAPRIVERLAYRRDRLGYTDTAYRHAFVVPSGGGTARQGTTGEFDPSGIEWTPDGRRLLFSGLRVDDAEYQWRESEIYAVDPNC